MREKKSCGVIPAIQKENETLYLLILQTNNLWAFPKGGQEKEESDLETAIREFREETGLQEPEILPDAIIQESYFAGSKWFPYHKTVTYFVGLLPEDSRGAVQIQTSEIKDYAWLPYKKARQKLTYDNTRETLKKAHKILH